MIISCFFLALIILGTTCSIVYFKRKNFNRAVQIMLIGIVLIITVLIFPMYQESYDSVSSMLFSILYALRSLSGCQSVDVSHKVVIEGWVYYGYYAVLYLAFIIAPIFTTSFLISIFGNLNDKIRYALITSNELHIFSELNESAVSLCESLNDSKKRLIFCNTKLNAKDKGTELVRRARRAGAIILDTAELDLKIRKEKVRFYQISYSKDYNINSAIALIEKYRSETHRDIGIATFATGTTSELLLDSIDKGNIRVKLLDEVKYMCYALLDQEPLFERVDNKISALIIGCDYAGTEMLKAITWCGQITGYQLEVNVIDKNADYCRQKFAQNCPEICQGQYDIRFIQADVNTADFETALDKYCRDTTYVVVMTGDDSINIRTAIYLRKYFLKKDNQHFHNRPTINLRVRDALKNKQMDALRDANIETYGLHAFGSLEKTFNINALMSSALEKMAIGVHLAYSGALNGTDSQVRHAMETYYINEYNQRSSFAAALHIKYKLYVCGVYREYEKSVSEDTIRRFERLIQDPEALESLAILEHDRWMAFMRTEGYSIATPDEVKVYHSLDNRISHIHYLAKLHPSLVPWNQLDQISCQIGRIMDRAVDFKQSDYDIVRRIPDILRAQNSKITYWD